MTIILVREQSRGKPLQSIIKLKILELSSGRVVEYSLDFVEIDLGLRFVVRKFGCVLCWTQGGCMYIL